jgi:hypothetical protein
MKGLMKMMPDGHYDLKAFATDDKRANVTAFAVFSGTHYRAGWAAADRQEHAN